MNFFSLFRNILSIIYLLICMFVWVQFSGCYSFTGGSVPDHLKTLYIAQVNDNSGYGNPAFKNELTKLLFDKFRKDNSLALVDRNGDARLTVVISSIKDETITVKPGEAEKERKITVTCSVDYYDAVKKKVIFENSIVSNFAIYDISNAQSNRVEAVNSALDRISDDILLKVVSGW